MSFASQPLDVALNTLRVAVLWRREQSSLRYGLHSYFRGGENEAIEPSLAVAENHGHGLTGC